MEIREYPVNLAFVSSIHCLHVCHYTSVYLHVQEVFMYVFFAQIYQ